MCNFSWIVSSEWMMVIITTVYVFFTCRIMIANRKSAKISQEQLEESRKQFEKLQIQNETLKQLSFMPFLQLVRTDNQDDRYIDEIDITLYNKSSEYRQGINCKIHNIGNGTATDITYSWDCHQINCWNSGFPQINAIMHGDDYPVMLILELDDYTPDNLVVTITFEFKDLLGQDYGQRALLIFEGGNLVRIENDTPKACS